MTPKSFLLLIFLLLLGTHTVSAQLIVRNVSPSRESVTAGRFDPIEVQFNAPLDVNGQPSDAITVRGQQTGRYEGETTIVGETLLFEPSVAYKEGERITVHVSGAVTAASGSTLLAGVQWQFHIRPEEGTGVFEWQESNELFSPRQIDVGRETGPVETYAGDLDGDGLSDVVVVNRLQSNISIFRNRGTTLLPLELETRVSVGQGPAHVVGSDMDNDGDLDLVVSNQLDNTIAVLFNDGAFNFTRRTITTGARPVQTVPADFDGDGLVDLATVSFGEDAVVIHRNTGNGQFVRELEIPTGFSPVSIVSADFDADGRLDVAVAIAGEDRLEIRRNVSGGTIQFGSVSALALAGTPELIIAGNIFDDNELPDLLVAYSELRQVDGVRTLPNFSFQLSLAAENLALSPAGGLALANVNKVDPFMDLGLTHFADGFFSVLRGSGNPPFTQFGEPMGDAFPELRTPIGVTAVDLDRDGDIDFLMGNLIEDEVWVYDNQGGRTTSGGLPTTVPAINFGSVALCETATESVYFNNEGLVPITVQGIDVISAVGNSDAIFSATFGPPGTNPPFDIVPGDSVQVVVTFDPAEEGLITTFSTVVNYTAAGQEREAVGPLAGRGVVGVLDVVDSDFGFVVETRSETQSITVTNIGPTGISITGFATSNPAFNVLSPQTPLLVLAGQSVDIEVEFTPATVGAVTATLSVTTDDPCTPVFTGVLSGTGTELMPDIEALSLEAVVPEARRPVVTRTYSYNATYRVLDKAPTGPIALSVAVDDIVVFDSTLTDITVDATRTFRFSHAFSTLGSKEITLSLDPANAVEESSEVNNTTSLQVNVGRNDELVIRPNPFTPNSDGFNDETRFHVAEMALANPILEIFTIEGNPLARITQIVDGTLRWDGRTTAGVEQHAGLYVFIVKDGSEVIGSGTVLLVR